MEALKAITDLYLSNNMRNPLSEAKDDLEAMGMETLKERKKKSKDTKKRINTWHKLQRDSRSRKSYISNGGCKIYDDLSSTTCNPI